MSEQEVSVLRARRLFDSAPFAYLVTTSTGVVLEANDAASTLLRQRPGGLLQKSIAVLVSLPERHAFRQRMCRCVGGDEVLPWSVTLTPRISPAVICTATCRRGGDENRLLWTFHPFPQNSAVEAEARSPSSRRALADDLAVALHDARSVEDILDRMLRRFVAAHADFCMVELLAGAGRLVRCAASHADAERQHYMADLLRASGPAAFSASSFAKVGTVSPFTPEAMTKLSSNPDEYAVWMGLSLATFIRAPLIADGEFIGVITFGWTASRSPSSAHAAELHSALATASLLLGRALEREVGGCAVRGATSTLQGLTRDLAPVLDAILGHATLLTDHLLADDPPMHSGNGGSVGHLVNAARHARALVTAAAFDDEDGCAELYVQPRELDTARLLHEVASMLGPLAASNNTALEIVTPEDRLVAHADAMEARRVLIHLIECAINDSSGGVVRLSARAESEGIAFGFLVTPDVSHSDSGLPACNGLLFVTARDTPLLRHVRDVLDGTLDCDEVAGAVRLWIPTGTRSDEA